MEFWGLEVKPGATVKCVPGDDYVLHLSQAAIGESKKSNDNAMMYVKVDGKKLAIGTLSTEKYPQVQFDLVFEKEFELSHTSKAASVFFSGYKVLQPAGGDEMDFDSEEEEEEEEEEEIPKAVLMQNGKVQAKEAQKGVKVGVTASKANALVEKTMNKDDSDEDETDDSDEDDDLSPAEEGDDDGSSDEDDSSEDESDEDDEETPKKPEVGKKRAAENALKTPASDKKAKIVTPAGQKTGGKKSTHVATPHPAKQAGKTPANNDKSPKSAGSISCSSCSKTFKSEVALQAHAKAKKH